MYIQCHNLLIEHVYSTVQYKAEMTQITLLVSRPSIFILLCGWTVIIHYSGALRPGTATLQDILCGV